MITNKKPFKLQKGCHMLATFFATCNPHNNRQDGGNLPWAKDEFWLAHSGKIELRVAEGMLHASNFSRNVAKSRGSFYFSCYSGRNNCNLQNGVLHVNFFLQVATHETLRCKLQEKLLPVTWLLNGIVVTFSTIFTSYLWRVSFPTLWRVWYSSEWHFLPLN